AMVSSKPASTNNTPVGATSAINNPPSGAPSMIPRLMAVSRALVARSVRVPETAITSGSNTVFAFRAGDRPRPIARASANKAGSDSPTVKYTVGIAAIATAVLASVSTVIRRGPYRSVHGPDRATDTNRPTASVAATRPVWLPLPVVANTNHGIATAVMAPPNEAHVAAANSADS